MSMPGLVKRQHAPKTKTSIVGTQKPVTSNQKESSTIHIPWTFLFPAFTLPTEYYNNMSWPFQDLLLNVSSIKIVMDNPRSPERSVSFEKQRRCRRAQRRRSSCSSDESRWGTRPNTPDPDDGMVDASSRRRSSSPSIWDDESYKADYGPTIKPPQASSSSITGSSSTAPTPSFLRMPVRQQSIENLPTKSPLRIPVRQASWKTLSDNVDQHEADEPEASHSLAHPDPEQTKGSSDGAKAA